MAHYDSPEELPDEPDDVNEGDTVDVGATTFVMHKSDVFDLGMLRHLLESVIRALTQALEAFDTLAKTDSEKVNVMLNVLDSMHEWSHANRGPMEEWALGAAEREALAEAESILRGERHE